MKDVELRVIRELIRDCRRSDRELAKPAGVSQPTVSRIRPRLEKEGIWTILQFLTWQNWALRF